MKEQIRRVLCRFQGGATPALRGSSSAFWMICAALSLLACSDKKGPRLVILGLDAANWVSMEPLLEEGLLPNLSRLIREGAAGSLSTFIPTASPAIWTTIATGQSPDKHGIAFRVLQIGEGKPGEEMLAAISSDEREVKALWNLFTDYGIQSAFIGWWATWPAEKILGYVVSDKVYEPRLKRTTFPTDLRNKLARQGLLEQGLPPEQKAWFRRLRGEFNAWRQNVEEGRTRWTGTAPNVKRYFQDLEEKLQAYRRIMALDYRTELITHHLMDTDPPVEVIAPYFWYMDICQHIFWKYWKPEGFDIDEKELEIFGKLVPHYYEFIDEVVGRILDHAGRHAMVVVVSDHGMESYYSDAYVNDLFDVEGVLVDLGWSTRGADRRPDLARSKAYVKAGSRQMRLINLSVQGREPHGKIQEKDRAAMVETLAEQLKSLKTRASSRPLFNEVRILGDSEQSYSTGGFVYYVFERADLALTLNNHVDLDDSLNVAGKVFPLSRWNKWRPSITGHHSMAPAGIVILKGAPFQRGARLENARVHDVTPTIMAAFGLPVAEDLEGRVLAEGFRQAFFENSPVISIPGYGARAAFVKEGILEGSADDALIQQLKAIGYIR